MHKAAALSWSEWGSLIRAWWLLLFFDLALRTLSFPRVKAIAEGKNEPFEISEEAQAIIEQLQRVTDIAARNHLYTMGCLRQSLALQWLLGRQGIAAQLRFGVRKSEKGLLAHAWLEYGGEPIGVPGVISGRFATLVAAEGK